MNQYGSVSKNFKPWKKEFEPYPQTLKLLQAHSQMEKEEKEKFSLENLLAHNKPFLKKSGMTPSASEPLGLYGKDFSFPEPRNSRAEMLRDAIDQRPRYKPWSEDISSTSSTDTDDSYPKSTVSAPAVLQRQSQDQSEVLSQSSEASTSSVPMDLDKVDQQDSGLYEERCATPKDVPDSPDSPDPEDNDDHDYEELMFAIEKEVTGEDMKCGGTFPEAGQIDPILMKTEKAKISVQQQIQGLTLSGKDVPTDQEDRVQEEEVAELDTEAAQASVINITDDSVLNNGNPVPLEPVIVDARSLANTVEGMAMFPPKKLWCMRSIKQEPEDEVDRTPDFSQAKELLNDICPIPETPVNTPILTLTAAQMAKVMQIIKDDQLDEAATALDKTTEM